MALILIDGCEDDSSWVSSASGQFSPTGGRNGGYLYGTVSQTHDFLVPTAVQSATMTMGFAYAIGQASTTTGKMLAFRSDSNTVEHITFVTNSDGSVSFTRSGTVLVTSAAGLLPVNGTATPPFAWNYIEVQVTLSATVGQVSCNINGTSVINTAANLNTKNAGTKTVLDTVRLNAANSQMSWDDLYLMAGTGDTFLGDCAVETLYPNGNGTTNQWTNQLGNSTNNYSYVSETGAPNTNTYTDDSTSGHQDMYTFTDLVRTIGTIQGVCHSVYAGKTDSGAKSFQIMNHRSSDTASSAQSPPAGNSTGWAAYQYVLTQDPETSAAWTVANVNALQAGVKVV